MSTDGVPGLWAHLSKITNNPESVPLSQILTGNSTMRVAVDAQSFIEDHTRVIRNKIETGQKNSVVAEYLCAHARNITCSNAMVQPLFVFGGQATSLMFKAGGKGAEAGAMGAEAGKEDGQISEHRIAIIAKEGLKHMGISFHDATVKPVAECVAMEKADYVDAVMSNNSDAFLFGARRVLYHDKTMNGVMVKDFLACNLLSAMPPYLRSIQQVFLTANLLANSVAFCGPAIACQLGASTYGNELWKLVKNKQWKRDLIEDWTRRVVEQFQTNSDGLFETTCPVIAKDLSDPSNTERFHDPMVIESLMEGLKLQKRRPHYTQAKISDFYSDDSAQSPDVPVISSPPTSPHAQPVLGEISTNSTPKSNRSERVKREKVQYHEWMVDNLDVKKKPRQRRSKTSSQ